MKHPPSHPHAHRPARTGDGFQSARLRRARSRGAAVATLVIALALSACGPTSAETPEPRAAAIPTSGGTPSAARTEAVRLESGWAKAGSGMTAVFGTVVNGTDASVTITGGSSPSAGTVQVHTMAKQPDGTMRMAEKKGGLVVPAGGSVELAPGADHLMLLDLRAPLANGEDVTLVLATTSGARLEWVVPVRAFAGADETYAPESQPATPMSSSMPTASH